MRNNTVVISEAHWEENIHYPHNQWEVVSRQHGKVELRRISWI